MIIRTAAAFGLCAALTITVPVWAKGDMVLIEIKGATLPAPIQITDPKIAEFTIWAGPGVNGVALEYATGFIVDWRAGFVERPASGLQHYEVSFYEGCAIPNYAGCLAVKPQLAYVVSYDYDPSSKRGFVYLPGKGEPWFELNATTIYRRVEGRWFRANDSWERFVSPLIALARSRNP